MVSVHSGPPDMDDANPSANPCPLFAPIFGFRSTVAPETPPSGPAISLKNLLLLDYPEEAIILRSQDSYDFRVPKLYIMHSSPILREVLTSLNPQPGASVILAESDVKESTGVAKELRVVQLPVTSTILISLLTYIFPVPPILPSTTEQIMGLLSVAQMYKMGPVLTHIRNHIAQQNPPLIRKETAFPVYALAQKHGLRTEALQAARCTLSFSTMIIERLAEEERLGLMPCAFLYELWKYHQRVRESLTSDIEEFKTLHLNNLEILEDTNCSFSDLNVPFWLECYVDNLGKDYEPFSLDFTSFNVSFVEHRQGGDSKYNEVCESCSNMSQEDVCAIWDSFTAVVQGCIAKAESEFTLSVEGTRFEHEVQPRSSMEAPSLPKYSDMPNADIILQSSDLVNFRVHRLVLVTSSPFFRDMFSLPQPSNDVAPDGLPVLHLSETAEVLNSLISMLYPVPPEMPRSIDNILALLAATEKYDMSAVQSFIRAEVSCNKELLSPSDSGEAFHIFTAAWSKRLIPEMETAARLTLNYPLTFDSVGEALRAFDVEALCGLVDFRKRCVDKLASRMESFSDSQNGPSTIWAGCPVPSSVQYNSPQLPWWLARVFRNPEGRYSFDDPVPTSMQFRNKFLEALQGHINEKDCHFCLKVYALKGEVYCAELEDMLELARNVPFQKLGDDPTV